MAEIQQETVCSTSGHCFTSPNSMAPPEYGHLGKHNPAPTLFQALRFWVIGFNGEATMRLYGKMEAFQVG